MSLTRFLIGLAVLALLLGPVAPAQAQDKGDQEPPPGWSFLTLDRNFDRLPADWRDPYTGFKIFGIEDRDGTGAEASLGVYVGLARYYDPELKQTLQFGVESGFFALFDWASGGSLNNRAADYWVGLNSTYSQGGWQAKVVVGHLSSHPGDWTLLNEDPDADKVSWEVVKGALAWSGVDWLRIYAGGSVYLTHTDWAGKGDAQVGAMLRYPVPDSPLTPYITVDLQFRERTDWEVSTSVEGGIDITPQGSPAGIRIYGFYYKGDNPSGTFRLTQETRYGGGLSIDF